jgi:hypothetical protein
MGNWMTVRIVGTCGPADVWSLRSACRINDDYSNFHCLSISNGLCSLGDWTGENIDRVGNLAERDYDANSVAEQLEKLAAVAPSLAVKVHCGGQYEAETCAATVTLANGKATVGPAEVEKVGTISKDQMQNNFLKQMMGF